MDNGVSEEKRYLFGPVCSRRLGLSLGVDIVPLKVCSLDCVYCQLGRTGRKSIERKDYVPAEAVLAELKERLGDGLRIDFITIGGSGEPTLNAKLGQIIEGIKKITDVPVAVLTNGTLLTDSSVRADCSKADVVLPSLDAGDQQTFQKINRPHENINIEKVVAGLCAFREEFAGEIWLEVFFVEGLNTDASQVAKIKGLIERIRPDKVQLNTAVRPAADAGIHRLEREKLHTIAARLGANAEVIADATRPPAGRHVAGKVEYVLSMLKRRPCSLTEICSGLSMGRTEALEYLTQLQQQGVVASEQRDEITFFKASSGWRKKPKGR